MQEDAPVTRSTPDRDREILRMRSEGHSLEVIGREFGITRERVRQIVKRRGGPEVTEVLSQRRERRVQTDAARRDQILADLRHHPGASASEIASRTGLDDRTVKQLVPKRLRALMADQRSPARLQWPEERLLSVLRTASTHEFPLTVEAYTRLTLVGEVDGPTVAIFMRRFGSWRAACESAGVEPGEARQGDYQSNWTDSDILAFVADYLVHPQSSGSIQGYADWRVHTQPDAPSGGTVRNRFVSWTQAKRLALQALQSGTRDGEEA
ncbi:MAG: sigma factor-like helix-turn-helix DNA-binding protein [Dehalococcoidia bacterium]